MLYRRAAMLLPVRLAAKLTALMGALLCATTAVHAEGAPISRHCISVMQRVSGGSAQDARLHCRFEAVASTHDVDLEVHRSVLGVTALLNKMLFSTVGFTDSR